MSSRGSLRVRVAAAGALLVLGFAVSFGAARMTRGEATPVDQSGQTTATVAVLPPEAARLVRLSPGGAVPALRPAETTAPALAPAPAPQPQAQAQAEPQPAPQQQQAAQPQQEKPKSQPVTTLRLVPQDE